LEIFDKFLGIATSKLNETLANSASGTQAKATLPVSQDRLAANPVSSASVSGADDSPSVESLPKEAGKEAAQAVSSEQQDIVAESRARLQDLEGRKEGLFSDSRLNQGQRDRLSEMSVQASQSVAAVASRATQAIIEDCKKTLDEFGRILDMVVSKWSPVPEDCGPGTQAMPPGGQQRSAVEKANIIPLETDGDVSVFDVSKGWPSSNEWEQVFDALPSPSPYRLRFRQKIPRAPALTEADLKRLPASQQPATPASASRAAATPSAPAAAPTRAEWENRINLSQCDIGEFINQGNFGVVSWVKVPAGTPPLVMKEPKNPAGRTDFKREAQFYAQVGDHPNIARSLGMQTIAGHECLVVEGIQGSNVSSVMKQMKTLLKGDKDALKKAGLDRNLTQAQYTGVMQYITAETLKGLQHLERRHVVHNDIRPDNIMCDAETGAIKIVDFGVSMDARRPKPATVASPIGFGSVSPDIIPIEDPTTGKPVNRPITGKHDVFSAGALAREGLEGEQFRYNKEGRDLILTVEDFIKFGAAGQSALRRIVPRNAQAAANGNAGEDVDRFEALETRIDALLRDRFIANTDAAAELMDVFKKAEAKVFDGSAAETAAALAVVEARVAYAETHLKTSGTFAMEGGFAKFVNQTMNPDRDQRPNAAQALLTDFINDPAIDPEAARALLKQILAPKKGAGATPSAAAAPASAPMPGPSPSPASASASASSSASAAQTPSGPPPLPGSRVPPRPAWARKPAPSSTVANPSQATGQTTPVASNTQSVTPPPPQTPASASSAQAGQGAASGPVRGDNDSPSPSPAAQSSASATSAQSAEQPSPTTRS